MTLDWNGQSNKGLYKEEGGLEGRVGFKQAEDWDHLFVQHLLVTCFVPKHNRH